MSKKAERLVKTNKKKVDKTKIFQQSIDGTEISLHEIELIKDCIFEKKKGQYIRCEYWVSYGQRIGWGCLHPQTEEKNELGGSIIDINLCGPQCPYRKEIIEHFKTEACYPKDTPEIDILID